MNKTKLLGVCLATAGLIVAFSACVYDPRYPGPRYHPYYYPFYYDYYYYPGVRVYFQFSTGYYFYFSRNRWVRTRVLPPHIHLRSADRVKIRIDSDKPYLRHREHARRYPSRTRPVPGTSMRDRRPPEARPGPGAKPSTPSVRRREPSVTRRERDRNLELYRKHQKQQKQYKEEWEEKRKKKDRR